MIRKHEKPLEQVINRYNEIETFGITNLNKPNKKIEYLKPYSGGLLSERWNGPEFKIAIKNNIKINIKSSADIYIGYCLDGRLNIFKILNICCDKSKVKVFVAQAFNKIQPFYIKPINSLKLGIAIVDELSNHMVRINIEKCSYLKYMILNNGISKIAFPILHTADH